MPGFLIAAGVFGLRAWRELERLCELSGACPACGERVAFDPPARLAPATRVRCPACGDYLTLR